MDPSLLVCTADSEPPAKGADDNEVGKYLTLLWAAWDDCHEKLARVKNVLQEFGTSDTVVP